MTVLGPLGPDRHFARRIHALHGLDGVEDEIRENLLHLYPICHDLRKILRQRSMDCHRVSVRLAAQQNDDVPDSFIDVHRLALHCVPF